MPRCSYIEGTTPSQTRKLSKPVKQQTISPERTIEPENQEPIEPGYRRQERSDMSLTEVVRARVDPKTKEQAEAVLAEIGLNISDAIRLMLIRIAREKAMPFNPLVPNQETVEAMLDARAGRTKRVGSVDALFAELNADDSDDELNEEVQTGLQTGKGGSARKTA